jgi:hypothetical protein
MSIEGDVRKALMSLIRTELVHTVLPEISARSQGEAVAPGTSVTVLLNASNPELHREKIERLLKSAGLAGINFTIQRNPLYHQTPVKSG